MYRYVSSAIILYNPLYNDENIKYPLPFPCWQSFMTECREKQKLAIDNHKVSGRGEFSPFLDSILSLRA